MMTHKSTGNLLVGAGGWAYFHVPGRDSLRAYSSSFDFVEVNSTFYEYPDLRAVSLWRSRVPRSFEFSVRCHGDIARAFRQEKNYVLDDVVGKMSDICRALEANILTILVPKSLGITDTKLAKELERVASTFDARTTRIAVELRGGAPRKILKVMADNNIVHCVDISREQPAYESKILYSRLFGKGQDNKYQFDDDEIADIASKASAPKFEKSILAFHGVRMYGDAARLKAFLQTGRFLQVTGQTGLDSLRTVLKEDVAFPVTKRELIARQGWKLFDLTIDTRVKAGHMLSKLPNRTYTSHKDLVGSLEPFFSNEPR